MAEARKEKWIIIAHLLAKYNKLPSSLADIPIDNWYPEEQEFIFFLDAYWSKQSSAVQAVAILKREISDAIKAPAKDYLPESIKASVGKLSENKEQKGNLKAMMEDTVVKFKKLKIDELLDYIKEYLTEEGFMRYKIEIDKELLKNGQ